VRTRTRGAGLALSALTAVTALTALAACGSGDDGPDRPRSAGLDRPAGLGTVTVLAASSLTEAFGELGDELEAQHPGTRVRFSFAASSELATQITSGAPADVFASASPSTMDQVVHAGDADGDPTVFVRNRLEIAVPAGNPAGVAGLADLADESLTIALCAPEVPCGAAAESAFEASGITPAPDTLEPDVKATLAKVSLGEVDAALVYRTDVIAAGDDVEGIDFPESADAVNDYPVVTLAEAPNAEGAKAFVDLVLSDEGRSVLEAAGFERP
jgi:molybdate transport system substrate-binding protein